MKLSYQPTLVPGIARAVTLNYTDDGTPAKSITMFNAEVVTSVDPSTKAVTATVNRVDGDGQPISDTSGTIGATATDPSSEDAAIKAAANTLAPRVLPAPAIRSVTPAAGAAAGGGSVVIEGTYLVGATAVTFGGVAATSFTVNGPQQITAVAPPGTIGAVDVAVTVPGGTATAKGAFTYQ